MFREISGATVFGASSAEQMERWTSALAALIDDLFAAQHVRAATTVVAEHALSFTRADVALLCTAHGADGMVIRDAAGHGAHTLAGSLFDRASSVAGRVLDTGTTAYVGMPRLKSPIDPVTSFGPMVITPLDGAQTRATLGVARVAGDDPLERADLPEVAAYAAIAGIALRVDHARRDREGQRIHDEHDRLAATLLDSLIRDLFAISIRLDGAIARIDAPDARAAVQAAAERLDKVVIGVRDTIFTSAPPVVIGEPF